MESSNIKWIVLIALILLYLIFKAVRGKKMQNKLSNMPKDSYILVDVREADETASGMIENAINIPLSSLESKLNLLDKNKDILLYCASGRRSGIAKSMLDGHGFKAYNLGGYSDLKK